MANPCYNYITFTGPKENLESLVKLLKLFISTDEDGNITDHHFDMVGFKQVVQMPDNDAGSSWFQPSHFEYSDEYIVISGDSAWRPIDRLVIQLCNMYSIGVTHQYEEGQTFYGVDTYTIDKEHYVESYDYWEGVSILAEDDYVELAKNEIDADIYESTEEFFSSDIWNYCPEGLKEVLREAIFSHISEQEDNELSAKSSTDV